MFCAAALELRRDTQGDTETGWRFSVVERQGSGELACPIACTAVTTLRLLGLGWGLAQWEQLAQWDGSALASRIDDSLV